jgi:hypothetical protein
VTDTWNGEPLPDRNRVQQPLPETIHYRLYDQRTRKLLSFNSTNSLGSIVTDVARTQLEHPDAKIIAVQFDGPAYTT